MIRLAAIRRSVVAPVAAMIVMIVTWEGLLRAFKTPMYLLPPPSAIFRAAIGNVDALAAATRTTGSTALIAFGLSASLGLVIGIILASSRTLERALYPYTSFLQTVPITAIAPLLVIWFGPGPRAVSVAAVITAIFPVIANTLSGIRSTDPALRDLFRLYGAGRLATLIKLELPAAMPSIITGLRISGGLSVIGTLGGEFIAGYSEGNAGLGILVMATYRELRTDLLFAANLLTSLLGLLLFGGVQLFSYYMLRGWHPSVEASDD